jgi:SEC-C motif-containing protein
MKRTTRTDCNCGSGQPFALCCGPLLDGNALPATAEALMRSRYTAYCRGNDDYVRTTWHPATCPVEFGGDGGLKWLGLKIVATRGGGPEDNTGEVEFVARYKPQSQAAGRLHEISRFERLDGRWVYVDGTPGATDSGPSVKGRRSG